MSAFVFKVTAQCCAMGTARTGCVWEAGGRYLLFWSEKSSELTSELTRESLEGSKHLQILGENLLETASAKALRYKSVWHVCGIENCQSRRFFPS